MENPVLGKSKDGRNMHYSVGALIERDREYLLVDRRRPPLGFAGIAGHINEGETKELALTREIKEESQLKVDEQKLILEEEVNWNTCSRGIGVHYWYLFDCKTSGRIRLNFSEAKSIGWYPPEKIRELTLEPIWSYWFKKLNKL